MNTYFKALIYLLPLLTFTTLPALLNNQQNITLPTIPENKFSITTSPAWQEFRSVDMRVHVGSFIFNTRPPNAKQTYHLKKIHLHWVGEPLATLNAELYQKHRDKDPLIPIQSNLVCVGKWNAKTQELIFHLDRKLYSVDSLYLVLSFPSTQTTQLKNGLFILDQTNPVTLKPV